MKRRDMNEKEPKKGEMAQRSSGEIGPARAVPRTPPVDVFEQDADYVILADLPGVLDADVICEVDQNTLKIGGHRRRTGEGRAMLGAATEIDYVRRIGLPDGADTARIQAKLDRGTLMVTIPKLPGLQPRRIPIGP